MSAHGRLPQLTSDNERPPARRIAAVVAGNALEYYDFVTYAYFAVYIGETFFPSDNPASSLLASLATFGSGFLTRPLGALIVGRQADKIGRKPTMLLSFGLMGFAIVGLSLTPPPEMIGIAAPILLVFFRLLQGFALGAEMGPSTTYLFEIAPANQRGVYVSFQYAGQAAAGLGAGIVGLLLSSLLSAGDLQSFGWRIAMLIGAAVIPIGMLLRQGLEETLHIQDRAAPSARPSPKAVAKIAGLGLVMIAAGTTVSYVLKYMTTYAIANLGLSPQIAFTGTILGGIVGVVACPIGGWLSDKFGRKPILIVPWAIMLLAIFPAFSLIAHFRTPAVLYASTCFLGGMGTLAATTALLSVTESLPKKTRSGSLAIVYAIAISIFGGTAQFNVAWLISATGDVLAPAWYMIGGVSLGLIAMMFVPETAPIKTAQRTGGGPSQ